MNRAPRSRRPRLLVPGRAGAALVLATALPALASCGGAGQPVSQGQALFEENCVSCHGERGLGDGPMAADLPVQPASLLEHLGHHPMDQLVAIIRTGVPPAMPPAPLTEPEVRLVIDYAWTLVPDSLVEELRAMQRMAETGMPMEGMERDAGPMEGMEMEGTPHGGMHAQPDSAGR